MSLSRPAKRITNHFCRWPWWRPTPYAASKFRSQVILQPATAFPDDLHLIGADLFLQFAECRFARRLARSDAALGHLPRRRPGHVDAAANKYFSLRIEQHDADSRAIAERLVAPAALLHHSNHG